jgi:hypothetical protein
VNFFEKKIIRQFSIELEHKKQKGEIMKTTSQIHSDNNPGAYPQSPPFDIPVDTEKTYRVNHNFSQDILKIDTTPTQNSPSQSDNNKFSDALYQELLNNGIGSKENFERVFHLQ